MSARTSPIGSSSGEPAPGPVADEGSDRPRPSSADFREAVAFLSSTRRFGMNPSLEGTGRLADALGKPHSLITHVEDRKGHDMRYAIDPTKIHNELGWLPETKFQDGIQKTIRWYLDNDDWWQPIISGEYQNYYEKMYGSRKQI